MDTSPIIGAAAERPDRRRSLEEGGEGPPIGSLSPFEGKGDCFWKVPKGVAFTDLKRDRKKVGCPQAVLPVIPDYFGQSSRGQWRKRARMVRTGRGRRSGRRTGVEGIVKKEWEHTKMKGSCDRGTGRLPFPDVSEIQDGFRRGDPPGRSSGILFQGESPGSPEKPLRSAGLRVGNLDIPDASCPVRQLQDCVCLETGWHLLAVRAGEMVFKTDFVMGHGISPENGHVLKRRASVCGFHNHDTLAGKEFREINRRKFRVCGHPGVPVVREGDRYSQQQNGQNDDILAISHACSFLGFACLFLVVPARPTGSQDDRNHKGWGSTLCRHDKNERDTGCTL